MGVLRICAKSAHSQQAGGDFTGLAPSCQVTLALYQDAEEQESKEELEPGRYSTLSLACLPTNTGPTTGTLRRSRKH